MERIEVGVIGIPTISAWEVQIERSGVWGQPKIHESFSQKNEEKEEEAKWHEE